MRKKKNIEDHARVHVRVRPLSAKEGRRDDRCCYNASQGNMIKIEDNDSSYDSTYYFEKVYGEDETTEDVYNGTVKDIARDTVRKGLNGTVILYGQTNTGKTFTIQGHHCKGGIVHLAAKEIFSQINKTPDRDFLVRVSFIEIYKEKIHDLLHENGKKKNLNVYHGTTRGTYVDSHYSIATGPDSLIENLKKGAKNRSVGSTKMNKYSSKSHSIFRIMIESRESSLSVNGDSPGYVLFSELTLVDLAGSECLKDSKGTIQIGEGAENMNNSLLALSNAVKSLSTPKSNVNYRDSKLTQVLQSSLEGNARIAFIYCITPSRSHQGETIRTIDFATKAKHLRINPKQNKVKDSKSLIKKLKLQLEDAKNKLEELERKDKVTSKSEKRRKDQAEKVELYQSYILNGRNSPERRKPISTKKSIPVPTRTLSQKVGILSVINIEGYHEESVNQMKDSSLNVRNIDPSESISTTKTDLNTTIDDQSDQTVINSLRDELKSKDILYNKLLEELRSSQDRIDDLEDTVSVFEEKAIACESLKCSCNIQ